MVGDAVQERPQFGLAHGGSGGVVRVADEDHARSVGDGVGERVEVVGLVAQGHAHRRRVGQVGEQRVGLERAPGVDDLGPGLGGGLQELLEHAHGAGADGHVVVGDAEPGGQGTGEGGGPGVGIAVDLGGGRGHGVEDRGQRTVGALVGGELHRPPVGTDDFSARYVGGDGTKYSPEIRRIPLRHHCPSSILCASPRIRTAMTRRKRPLGPQRQYRTEEEIAPWSTRVRYARSSH